MKVIIKKLWLPLQPDILPGKTNCIPRFPFSVVVTSRRQKNPVNPLGLQKFLRVPGSEGKLQREVSSLIVGYSYYSLCMTPLLTSTRRAEAPAGLGVVRSWARDVPPCATSQVAGLPAYRTGPRSLAV